MTMIDRKKKAIICAAVTTYLAARAHESTSLPPKAPVINAWGLSARQETMQISAMLQRRFWHHGA